MLNKKILILTVLILSSFTLVKANNVADLPQLPMVRNLKTQEVSEPTIGIRCQIINNKNIIENETTKKYMRNMRRQILLNLKYRPADKQSVLIQTRLNQDGSFTNSSIIKGSQDTKFNQDAINAIMKTRLQPLPQDFKKLYLDLSITIVSDSEY